ncbi:AAA family ATPase [Oryzomonas rubra]|uniref:Rad50/SbcC-type AAA domain-containing protein n=1 Tax=Oryzomonas rubra TaxID=2509454 RepID=A0A5A9XAU5_9BACT|nr:AAA family ATPase [Oryzomonas rubra]KAA0888791.1 hypothetical protein ET418_15535 [Oryzomonas rubra]
MHLKSINLRGFRGFLSGIGAAEVSINLEALPPGLIAICGPNGAGKTTLLDNLHPYRIQPFKIRKAKDWSPGAFSYYDQCYGSDARKELVFDMGGQTYKSLIMIDADRKKQECYLYFLDVAGTWQPMNDGKTKTYDEAIEKVCGSPSLFFTSIFRCQGAKNLSDYSRSDIMGILSELLNIDHIRDQGDKARQVVKELTARINTHRALADAFRAEIEDADRVQEQISNLDVCIASANTDLKVARTSVEKTLGDLQAAKERQASATSELARRTQLEGTLADTSNRHHAAIQEISREFLALEKQSSDVTQKSNRESADVEAALARSRKIAGNATELREKAARYEAVSAQIEDQRREVAGFEPTRDYLAQRQRSISGAKLELSGLSNRLQLLVSARNSAMDKLSVEIASAKRDSAKLQGLDCHGDGSGSLNDSCRFISDAVKARDGLLGLEAQREALVAPGQDEIVLQQKIDVMSAVTDADESAYGSDFAAFQEQSAGAARLLKSMEDELAALAPWHKLVPELDIAEVTIKKGTEDLERISRESAAALADLDSRISALRDKQSRLVSEYEAAKFALEAQISVIEVDVDIAKQVLSLEQEYSRAQAAMTSAESLLRGHELQRAGLLSKASSADKARGEVEKSEAEIARLNSYVSSFSVLAKACSNDGIIALELDDAAPTIASIVNDLLRACYGSRFSIRMDTQAQKVDGGTKEAFDIVIIDSETENERSITECSGGQISWIEDAITRGICLFNIHRSDRAYDTLYSDEKDGAMDPDKKMEFYQIKRESLRTGTHSREFFITQTPEMMDLADARIVLGNGGVSVDAR